MKRHKHSIRVHFFLCVHFFALVAILVGVGTPAHATKISHQLFDIKSTRLANGLHLIEQERISSDLTLMHLVVNVGLRDFPCEKQQIPHVIEHVLFENNTRFSAEELRAQIRNFGGYSNGGTTDETTHYTLSIHSDHEAVLIDTLFTMMSDIRWGIDDIERVKRVVDTEIETPVSPIQRWFDSGRALKDQIKAELYPGTSLDCKTRSAAFPLSLDEIKQAYDQFYHADNMTLIVIGGLASENRTRLIELLETLPKGGKQSTFEPPDIINPGEVVQKGGFGQGTAYVMLMTRGPGLNHRDYQPMRIINEFVSERLFSQVRLKYGLGYTPISYLESEADMGHLFAFSKTRSDIVEDTYTLFKLTYREIRSDLPRRNELERLKQKLSLHFEAQGRSADEIAELYRHYRNVIAATGRMPDIIAEIAAVTEEDIQRSAAKWLPASPATGVLRPPNQWEASVSVTGIIVGAALLAWPLNRRLQRRREKA